MEALSPMGFRCVRAKLLSMREQAELFRDAEVVAGPHGAGDEDSDFELDVPRLRTLLERELAGMAPASEVSVP